MMQIPAFGFMLFHWSTVGGSNGHWNEQEKCSSGLNDTPWSLVSNTTSLKKRKVDYDKKMFAKHFVNFTWNLIITRNITQKSNQTFNLLLEKLGPKYTRMQLIKKELQQSRQLSISTPKILIINSSWVIFTN